MLFYKNNRTMNVGEILDFLQDKDRDLPVITDGWITDIGESTDPEANGFVDKNRVSCPRAIILERSY